jgi:hypothetical protein
LFIALSLWRPGGAGEIIARTALLDLLQGKPYSEVMSPVVQKLASKLEEWSPEVSREVEVLVADIIALADLNVLDLSRSRRVEQEVIDLLDEPFSR